MNGSHQRDEMHDYLLAQIRRWSGEGSQRRCDCPALVAIDGPDAAGKTVLANELAALLTEDRPVIRASIDGFHRPRTERYRQGALSPEGYYEDSFDHEALRRQLLVPLRNGARQVVPVGFDLPADAPARLEPVDVPVGAVLLFEGVFLHRPELRPIWDLTLYLHVDEEESLRRARQRDLQLFGSVEEVERRYRARYLPGQAIYRARVDPISLADIVIDNNDVTAPKIIKHVPCG